MGADEGVKEFKDKRETALSPDRIALLLYCRLPPGQKPLARVTRAVGR